MHTPIPVGTTCGKEVSLVDVSCLHTVEWPPGLGNNVDPRLFHVLCPQGCVYAEPLYVHTTQCAVTNPCGSCVCDLCSNVNSDTSHLRVKATSSLTRTIATWYFIHICRHYCDATFVMHRCWKINLTLPPLRRFDIFTKYGGLQRRAMYWSSSEIRHRVNVDTPMMCGERIDAQWPACSRKCRQAFRVRVGKLMLMK